MAPVHEAQRQLVELPSLGSTTLAIVISVSVCALLCCVACIALLVRRRCGRQHSRVILQCTRESESSQSSLSREELNQSSGPSLASGGSSGVVVTLSDGSDRTRVPPPAHTPRRASGLTTSSSTTVSECSTGTHDTPRMQRRRLTAGQPLRMSVGREQPLFSRQRSSPMTSGSSLRRIDSRGSSGALRGLVSTPSVGGACGGAAAGTGSSSDDGLVAAPEELAPAPLRAEDAPKLLPALSELLVTERSYVAVLKTLVHGYLPELSGADEGEGLLQPAEVRAIFGNVALLLGVNETLLEKLELALEIAPPADLDERARLVAEAFDTVLHYLKAYVQYCAQYFGALSTSARPSASASLSDVQVQASRFLTAAVVSWRVAICAGGLGLKRGPSSREPTTWPFRMARTAESGMHLCWAFLPRGHRGGQLGRHVTHFAWTTRHAFPWIQTGPSMPITFIDATATDELLGAGAYEGNWRVYATSRQFRCHAPGTWAAVQSSEGGVGIREARRQIQADPRISGMRGPRPAVEQPLAEAPGFEAHAKAPITWLEKRPRFSKQMPVWRDLMSRYQRNLGIGKRNKRSYSVGMAAAIAQLPAKEWVAWHGASPPPCARPTRSPFAHPPNPRVRLQRSWRRRSATTTSASMSRRSRTWAR